MKNVIKNTLLTVGLILTINLQVFAQEPSDDELLNMSLEELMDIDVVNVSKLNLQNLSEVPSAVTIVTAEQIEDMGAKNMEEVMRLVPGFDVVRNGYNPTTNFGVRGLFSTAGTNNKILFMVDDHPIRSVFLNDASVFLGNYPLSNIKQIEIIRGPGSTLFGAGAFLAVVNIRTKQADNAAELKFSAGSFNTVEGSGLYTLRKGDNLSLTISGNYLKTDGPDILLESDISIEIFDSFAPLFGFTGGTTSIAPGNLNFGRESGNLDLRLNFKDFYLLGGHIASNDQPPIGVYEALTRNNDIDNKVTYLEAGYRTPVFSDQGELLIKTYYDQYVYKSRIDLFGDITSDYWNFITGLNYATDTTLTGTGTFYGDGEAQFYTTNAKNDDWGIEANFAYNFESKVNLLAGFMYEQHRLYDSETFANGNIFFEADRDISFGTESFIPIEAFGTIRNLTENYNWIRDEKRNVTAAFGQADLNLKNIFKAFGIHHFKLVGGVRFDHYSDVGDAINPRAALLLAPNQNIYVKGLYGEAFRAPSFIELYTQNSPVNIGNPDLNPETIRTVEAVLGYKVDRKLDINVTYFDTKINDNIQLVPDDDPSTFANIYSNIGDVKTSGVEVEARYDFVKGGYLRGSFTYQNVLDVTPDDSISAFNFATMETLSAAQEDFNPGGVPSTVFNFSGNYPINEQISLNISGNIISQRERTQASTFEFDTETFLPTGNTVLLDQRAAISGRAIINATVRLRNLPGLKGLELQVSGYNLMDVENYNPTLSIREADIRREGVNFRSRIVYKF